MWIYGWSSDRLESGAAFASSGGRALFPGIGEEQILGQVKEADAWAQECQTSGPVLSRLFRSAITAGKRIRTEVSFGPVGSSVASQAVDKADEILGGIGGNRPWWWGGAVKWAGLPPNCYWIVAAG